MFVKQGEAKFLDMEKVIKLQLLDAGIMDNNIEVSLECTFKLHNKFYSYRRDKPKIPETMMVIFGRNN